MKYAPVCLAHFFFLSLAGLVRAQCPLPPDLAISPPAPTVPAELANFAGAWGGGGWGGELPTFLIVESFAGGNDATLVYSWGKSPDFAAGWTRVHGSVIHGRLHAVLSGGPNLDFWLEPNGALFGRYTSRGNPASVELHHLDTADPAALRSAAAQPVAPEWTEIEIPGTASAAAGHPLKIQATLYRQPETGRHPLMIFNHGSTGPGVVPASLVDRAWEAALIFRSLGYSVVVPMRRGRGKSEGELIEESDPSPTVQLTAAMEDLDAVMTYMRQQPYVDPSRIVLSGQSRGGFLAVVYAARHPREFSGVVEFSGGWFSENHPQAEFNAEQLEQAGRTGGPPMLWLCAQRDSLYSPAYVVLEFGRFKAAGGQGRLLTFDGIRGEGHFLYAWPEKWRQPVTEFLRDLPASRL